MLCTCTLQCAMKQTVAMCALVNYNLLILYNEQTSKQWQCVHLHGKLQNSDNFWNIVVQSCDICTMSTQAVAMCALEQYNGHQICAEAYLYILKCGKSDKNLHPYLTPRFKSAKKYHSPCSIFNGRKCAYAQLKKWLSHNQSGYHILAFFQT